LNNYYGNGLATSKDSPTSPNSNNFGVGLVFGSNNNTIEENRIGGNMNGVYIDGNGNAGNVIRSNIVMGNPPAQVSMEFGASIGADIQDMSTLGTNTLEDNRCLTYAGATVPAPCPRVQNDGDVEAQYRESVWPSTAIAQTQLADVGLINSGGGITQAGAATLLVMGLAVAIRRYRNLSGKN
jgi:parallel beta-helix repeat protein